MAYYVPPSKKVWGGHFPHVPHQFAPMISNNYVSLNVKSTSTAVASWGKILRHCQHTFWLCLDLNAMATSANHRHKQFMRDLDTGSAQLFLYMVW